LSAQTVTITSKVGFQATLLAINTLSRSYKSPFATKKRLRTPEQGRYSQSVSLLLYLDIRLVFS